MGRHISIGDNLEFLGNIASGSAQLVYMDPPFASGRDFKAVVRKHRDGGEELVDAFSDRWNGTQGVRSTGVGPVDDLLGTLSASLPASLRNYLQMMAPRIVEAHRILDKSGSIYLHCDPSASHYLRLFLDLVFGTNNFRNEIIWRRTHAHSSSHRFGPVHDTILFYSKSDKYVWNRLHVPYSSEYIEKYYSREDEGGRYQLITCTGPGDRTGTRAHYEWRGQYPPAGRHWAWQVEKMRELEARGLLVYSASGTPRLKRYLSEAPGVVLQDVWSDIPRLDAHSNERVGYDTQKPLELLRRIIRASTELGGFVVDPFAGSGSSAVAAELEQRSWAVADVSLLAGSITLARARERSGDNHIELSGFPATTRSAKALQVSDPATFGVWGTSILGAQVDRDASNGQVTKGVGVLGRAGGMTRTRSWVPLNSKADVRMNGDETIGASLGLVLGEHSAARALREQIRTSRPGFDILHLPLAEAVSEETRRRGLVASLPGVT